MLGENERFVSMAYRYYYGDELIKGSVIVSKAMQFASVYVQSAVAKQIAETLKEQGKSVWRNGRALIGGTSNVDKSTAVDIDVDGLFDTFTLQTYDAGAPVHLVKDE